MKRLLLSGLVCTLLALPLEADVLEQIIVKVNGEILTKTDLEKRQVTYLRQKQVSFNQDDLNNDEKLQGILTEITPQLLVDAVDEMLLVQRGKELGYRLGDDQFKDIVKRIREDNKLDSEEAFQAALQQEGMTLADLRRSLERQMLVSRVQQIEVWGKVAISEEEAQAYYDQHRAEFTTPADITLREILVSVGDDTPADAKQKMINVAQEEAAKQKIEAIRVRLLAGEDFAKVAAEVSDAPSKANGGLVGPLRPDELAPAFQEMLAKMKVGDLSEPVRTTRGYQVLKLESSTEAKLKPFDEARDAIADKIFDSKRQGELDKYLEKLRGEAIIDWRNESLKTAYEQRLAKAATGTPGA